MVTSNMGRAVARAVSGLLPTATARLELGSGHVGFVVDKTALGQVFSEYFGFPCEALHRLLHTHHHSSSGAGTIGQIAASVIVESVQKKNSMV
jgi:hypothetical protein